GYSTKQAQVVPLNGCSRAVRMAAVGRQRQYDLRSVSDTAVGNSSFLTALPPPMLSVPAGAHFMAHFFRVEAKERCDLEAVLTEQDQFATLPVLPSCPINTELPSRLA